MALQGLGRRQLVELYEKDLPREYSDLVQQMEAEKNDANAQAAKGLHDISEGHWVRGLEEMLPAALRGPLHGYRYATEGAQDKSGVPIVEEVDRAAVVGQVLGLAPSAVRNAQEGRSAVYKADRQLAERRSKLIHDFARAEMAVDESVKAGATEVHVTVAEEVSGGDLMMPRALALQARLDDDMRRVQVLTETKERFLKFGFAQVARTREQAADMALRDALTARKRRYLEAPMPTDP